LVSVPEMFRYWLQGGRIDIGFLGAAQLDRYGNINTTVIGPYDKPKVRLPGAGGASEIATSANEIFIMLRQGPRAFVDKLDFVTSVGHGSGGDSRAKLGVTTNGPTFVVTDLGILRPDPETRELTLTSLHQGVDAERAKAATGWPLKVASKLETTPPPTPAELEALRALNARTARAHGSDA
jgi:glutaconate CoA-transferase, subunit B